MLIANELGRWIETGVAIVARGETLYLECSFRQPAFEGGRAASRPGTGFHGS